MSDVKAIQPAQAGLEQGSDQHAPSEAQQARLQRFRAAHSVDIHCHCLPGLDDGPETLEDSLDLCRALVDDGITTVIATPHQLGRYDGSNWGPQIRSEVRALADALSAENIPLQVKPGADVRIDERLCDLLNSGQVMTLADTGKYVLLELEHDSAIEPQTLLPELLAQGRVPILSHPERNSVLNKRVDSVIPWLENGAILQVTAGSLTGHFGPVAQKIAWQWLGRGYVDVVASDAHDARKRKPLMSMAIDLTSSRLTHFITRKVFIDNPALILNGDIIPGWKGLDLPAVH